MVNRTPGKELIGSGHERTCGGQTPSGGPGHAPRGHLHSAETVDSPAGGAEQGALAPGA